MTEEMSKKVIEFTQNYYRCSLRNNDNFCIERYVDYRDKFPEDAIHKILNSDNPVLTFDEIVTDWDIQCDDWYYENEFFKELREFCEENEIDEDEARCEVEENFCWRYPDSFLNPDVSTMWIINHGDMNHDFVDHNILNYAADYGYCNGLEKSAGLWWLAKQQGKLTELKQAISGKTSKHFFSTRELLCSLINYGKKIGNPFSGYAKRCLTESEDILNHTKVWQWFLDRDGDSDESIRNLVLEYCDKYEIPTFEYSYSDFTKSCIVELENCSYYMTALQFMVKMPLSQVIEIKQKIAEMENDKDFDKYCPIECKKDYGYITLAKNTMCGLFDCWGESGSLMEIKLEKDVKIPLKYLWDICSNEDYQKCCSVVESCWKKTIKEIKLKKIA